MEEPSSRTALLILLIEQVKINIGGIEPPPHKLR
jgi:hypothetical protein